MDELQSQIEAIKEKWAKWSEDKRKNKVLEIQRFIIDQYAGYCCINEIQKLKKSK